MQPNAFWPLSRQTGQNKDSHKVSWSLIVYLPNLVTAVDLTWCKQVNWTGLCQCAAVAIITGVQNCYKIVLSDEDYVTDDSGSDETTCQITTISTLACII